MLKLFEIDNFRGFDSPVLFDLRAGAYGFNEGVVKNGLVKNAIVYGRNGIGKSALGLALFDVISHLTDRETISEGYLQPYCNQNTGRRTARFRFVFDFNGNELEYEYEKAGVSDLRREQLFYCGEKLIDYDYAEGGERYVAPGLVGQLNIDMPDNKLSIIKYIYRNTPTNAVRPVTELVEFCERMLWYRCLSNGNDCAGYVSDPEVLDEGIYQSGKLSKFEAFLRANGIDYRLDFVERDGKHVMVVVFANGDRVAFERVASTGTKTLRLFFYWKVRALRGISFLFVDEFDAFLHFESSAQIVRTLNGVQGFQTVLTTHNTYLMRNDLTRPDCCFIMTKNRVTPLCRATDRVLREGHNLEKMYVNGAFAESFSEAERRPLFDLAFSGTAVITDDGRKVSYAELRQMTDAWAAEIPPRSLVFLLVGNRLESLVSYVGCLNHGIVPLMLSENIDAALLEELKRRYRPDFIFRDGVQIEQSNNPDNRTILYPDLALLLTTSGSTGSPKLVRQSYRNIEANRDSIVQYLKLDATERPITTLPMNYTYGLSIINSHLAAGATILLTDKTLMQREFWNFFNEQKATSFGGVPYTYEMLDKLMFFRRKLPSLRTMTQAGGKILPALHQKFAEWAAKEGKNFVVMYGQAEATARMSYLPPARALDKVGSMGIAIPGGRFEIVEGELVYYGDNVTLGYAECCEDLAKGDERHGKLVTGDMARVDEEGFYYIVGRKKRFLKIFGNRVNLDETEHMIKGAFPDIDCACGGVDDKMKIYVQIADGAEDDGKGAVATQLAAVRDFVAEKTHLNFTAFEVVAIDRIPKNESGKTLYAELK